MRRFILVLMLTLLPLQAWAGVAMTTSMSVAHLAVQQFVRVQAEAPYDVVLGASMGMPADCALRMGFTGNATPSASSHLCADCHACHTIALTEPAPINSTLAFSVPFERPVPRYFVSADLQLSQKPPIFSA